MFLTMILFSLFLPNLLNYVFNIIFLLAFLPNFLDYVLTMIFLFAFFCQIYWTIYQKRKAEKDIYLLIILFKKIGKKSKKKYHC